MVNKLKHIKHVNIQPRIGESDQMNSNLGLKGSPPFDPQASSTYKKIPCDSDSCQALSRYQYSNDVNDCQYSYSYGDKSFMKGILTTDTLTFDDFNGQKTAFPTSIFGCGHNNLGKFRSPSADLVGLGRGPLSLVSQISIQIDNRFSYCLVPRSASSNSKLPFGQEAIISRPGAVSTPLVSKTPQTYYYLSLEGVSIGDKTAKAETILKNAIRANPVEDPSGTFSLCYGAKTNINVPKMVFHFSGADLRVQPENTFRMNDGLLCMVIVPSDSLSIFGNFAQMNFQVEYDLQKRTVSFAPTYCTKQ
ncbi:hypothetical protein J1N35_044498 [Gossypium stocksii]|uniref:Peptidase A1 domain-containing protein n=1 Tax=Gossypium stocksii TaxID=47602 RepID=A0A9D3U9I0_9ROSI|nr:hypothetical protein J1N35_044498 [Gossypium stocksii]